LSEFTLKRLFSEPITSLTVTNMQNLKKLQKTPTKDPHTTTAQPRVRKKPRGRGEALLSNPKQTQKP
jgi:hypothetical protein